MCHGKRVLNFKELITITADNILIIFFLFKWKIRLGISCELSAKQKKICHEKRVLTFKVLITITADNILIFFFYLNGK